MPSYYIDNLSLSSYNESTLNGFIEASSERQSLFYTQHGIFTVKNGKLYKININHKTVQHHKYKNIEIVSDDSSEELTEINSQIPNDYYVKRLDIVKYKVSGNKKDLVTDAFFKNDNDFNCPMLHSTIDTFLSNLN